jgi:hypothetical protein
MKLACGNQKKKKKKRKEKKKRAKETLAGQFMLFSVDAP